MGEIECFESAMHASAPVGLKCSDCTIDEEPCPACYGAWWRERHPHSREISSVTELPVGKFDAVRTLRETLKRAEDGDIKAVIIICSSGLAMEDAADDGRHDIWAVWSEMRRYEVSWLQNWFASWLNKRYFGDYHADEEDDDE